MRGWVLEGELGRELAIDGARKMNSVLHSATEFEDFASDDTDPNPVFETRSCILSLFWRNAVQFAVLMDGGVEVYIWRGWEAFCCRMSKIMSKIMLVVMVKLNKMYPLFWSPVRS